MKYYRMDRKFGDRKKNGRNFNNKNNKEQIKIVSELREEHNEAFVKGVDISKQKLDDDEIGRSNLVVEFDSIKLN